MLAPTNVSFRQMESLGFARESQSRIQVFVEFQQVTAHPHVQPFSGSLRCPESPSGRHPRDSMRVDLREFILERNDGLARSWITLTAAPSKQLPVDAASLMQFRCDHMQTTELHDIGVETNIRSSAGHIGGNCDSALRSGSGDDLGFLGILSGVQQLMIKTTIGE